MENPRPEKVAVVDEVRDRLRAAQAAVLTEYRGLDVAALATLRGQLRAVGGTYKVYKNTLVRFAARDLGIQLDDMLTGPTAIAFVDGDVAGVAKALRDYSRTNPTLVVKGGVLGDRVVGADDVRALADLPSREQLLSQIAGLFAAPMQQFASLLDAVPRNFAYAVQALIDKGGANTSGADDLVGASPGDTTTPAPAPDQISAATADEPAAAAAESPAAESADTEPTSAAAAEEES